MKGACLVGMASPEALDAAFESASSVEADFVKVGWHAGKEAGRKQGLEEGEELG